MDVLVSRAGLSGSHQRRAGYAVGTIERDGGAAAVLCRLTYWQAVALANRLEHSAVPVAVSLPQSAVFPVAPAIAYTAVTLDDWVVAEP